MMEVEIDRIGRTLLDAPIGHVEQTISDIIQKPVNLEVVEQSLVSDTEYIRKVIIGKSQFPILHAVVKFDSSNIPKAVMEDLLQKKDGLGKILQKNKITAQRKHAKVYLERDKKTLNREYEIFCNGSCWFQVSEKIKLDLLQASKDG